MSIPKVIIEISRKLRKNMTPTEVFLWSKLKDKSLGVKILRQKPIYLFTENNGLKRYIIADFYLPEKKVVIEIDGNIHNKEEIYQLDKEKERLLQHKGISVIRFTNHEVLQNVDFVLGEISSLHGREVPAGGWDGMRDDVQKFFKKKSKKQKIIVIYGPTGAGKTDMSIEIAKFLDTEIISTDSRQIFKGMNIGTGKITHEEMQGVKHHMIDIIPPDRSYSVGEFQESAQRIIDDIHTHGKIPMLVGGTGLYIDSIIFERAFGELPSDAILRKSFEKFSTEDLYKDLQKIDPEYALEIHPNNRPYIERALEVKKVSGKSKRDFRTDVKLRYDVLFLSPIIQGEADMFSDTYRELLYKRINSRVSIMFQMGLLEEVTSLIREGFSEADFGINSIGYSEFFPYFRGEMELSEVQEKIAQHSRNYAKRQITWFKRYKNI